MPSDAGMSAPGRSAEGPDGEQCTFTVVIPAFNAARTLQSCINSVLHQTVSDFELVVVDDGSTDDTGRIAEGVDDPRIRVVHQENRGLPAARNAGIAVAMNSVVCFIDADDLFLPDYLAVVRQTFAADPGVGFVYTDTWTFDDRTRRVRRRLTASPPPPRPAPPTAEALFRALLKSNFMIIPVAVRRDAFRDAGVFDESLSSAEDWEMWLRLTAHGHRAAEAPGPLGLRRTHAEQMSGNLLRMADNIVATLDRVLREYPLSSADRALVDARLARALRERTIVAGEDPVRSPLRRLVHRLGRLRERVGAGEQWYATPPPAVSAAFPDLRRV